MEEYKNIQFDENLCVRRFLCLYDKTKSDHKDKNVCWNAWAKVAEEGDVENDK